MSWWHAVLGLAVLGLASAVAAGVAVRVAVRAVVRRPGTPEPVPPAERERRAMAVLAGPLLIYGLGCGGTDPRAPSPGGPYRPRATDRPGRLRVRRLAGDVFLDCSGAVAYILGIPRRIAGYARGYGWVSTDGLIADADDPAVELVTWVPIGGAVEAWSCLLVYGSEDTDGDGDRDRIGHVGIVTAVPDGWVYTGPASLEALTVWHCAASASPTGAVRVGPGRAWRGRGRVLRVVS